MSGEAFCNSSRACLSPMGTAISAMYLLVVAFRVAAGVLSQAEDGAFFGFRPQAFPGHIGAHSAEDVGAEQAQGKDADHDGHKNTNNDQQFAGYGESAEYFFLQLHARSENQKVEDHSTSASARRKVTS